MIIKVLTWCFAVLGVLSLISMGVAYVNPEGYMLQNTSCNSTIQEVIKFVDRTITNVTDCPIFIDCPVCENCTPCPVCVQENISSITKTYINRMYSCEKRIKYYEGLNGTERADNTSLALSRCNATLLQTNYTLQRIKDVIQ